MHLAKWIQIERKFCSRKLPSKFTISKYEEGNLKPLPPTFVLYLGQCSTENSLKTCRNWHGNRKNILNKNVGKLHSQYAEDYRL